MPSLHSVRRAPARVAFPPVVQLSLMATVVAGALLGFSSHVRADDAGAPVKLETIQVTGSSIRRTDTETPSPVQILTAEDIKKSGYTTLSDVLRNISANNQGTLSQSFNGAFAAGASGVALRGLTVGDTLVLIDGHRGTPYPLSDDGQRSFVDVSSIPFDAVERVEVLKDGASSIYGSDAIAGVVNIILKKSFEGTRINVDAGISRFGDGGTQHLSLIHGFKDLLSEGGNGYFTAEYRHQTPVLQINRPYLANRDYTAYGGVNATRGITNALNSGYPLSLTGYTALNNAPPTPSVLTPLAGGCAGTAPTAPGGINCPFYQRDTQLQPDTHNVNLLTKYTQALANDWTATLTASMFGSAAEQVSNNYTSTPGIGSFNTVFSGGPGLAAGFTVPNGIVGSDGQQLATTLTNLGTPRTRTDNENYRLIGELNGGYAGWDVEISGGFTKSLLHVKNTNYLSFVGLNTVLAANPNATAAQLNTILRNPANNATLAPEADATSSSELDFISLRGQREIAKLPGGPLALSMGLEVMHKDLHSVAPSGFSLGQYNNGNIAYVLGEQDTESAYFELDGQVLKNLELSVSGRYDNLNTYGSSTTPKIGFKFAPVEQATLRGTYSRGYRAPNPAESGNSQSAFFFNSVQDPLLCAGGGAVGDFPSQCQGALFPAYLQQTNAKLQPEKSGSFTLGLVLDPAPNLNATIDYYRIRVDNQIVTAAYIQPSSALLPTAIRGPQQTLSQITALTGDPANPYVTAPALTPVGPIAFIPSPYLNSNSTVTNGIDVDLRARFDLKEYGKLTSDLNINHVFHLTVTQLGVSYEEAGTHGPSTTSGDTGTPQTRATWNWTWSKGPLEVATNINYISGYGVTDPLNGLTDCTSSILSNYNGSFAPSSSVSPAVCHVASFTTFDLFGSYQLTKQLQVRGSVLNLFDRQAPLDLQTYGANNYNPSLHQSGAVGRFFNVGATYAF